MSKVKSIYLFVLLLITGFHIFSQSAKSDSLRALVKTQKEDSAKVDLLLALAEELRSSSEEEAAETSQQALDLAKSLNYISGISRAEILYANSIINLGKFEEAASVIDRTLKRSVFYKDRKGESSAYFTLGYLNENQGNYNEAVKQHLKALQIRRSLLEKTDNSEDKMISDEIKNLLALSYLNLGDNYEKTDNTSESVKNYLAAIDLFKELNKKYFLSLAYNNIGLVYLNTGKYNEALGSSFKALKIKEELKDEAGIGNTYHNIGNIYFNLGNYDEALKNYLLALALMSKNNDKDKMAMCYGNIGVVYELKGNFEEALKMYETALKETINANNKDNQASCYINIGNLLLKEGDAFASKGDTRSANEKYRAGLDNYKASFKILEEINDRQKLAILGINMGVAFTRMKKYDLARQYYQKSLKMNQEINNLQGISYVYGNFFELDTVLGDYKQAFRHHREYIRYRDSLVNEETSKKTVQMQMQYDFDKKETETRLLQEKKDAITQKELKHKKQQVNFSLLGIFLVALLAVFILRGYRQKQRANILLEEKNTLIASQKSLVEEKNKEITDSINYARRIQQAILSPEKTLNKLFSESFILYKPKDIVSGDFYWILHVDEPEKNKNIVAFAAADCTGHGVPGAFMSMLNSTLLNQTAYNPHINTPADALNFLNRELPKNLRSPDDTQNIKDGMDIAFCLIDLNKNLLHYSGANNPCWIIRNNSLIELKPVKQAITASEEFDKKPFSDHTFPLEKNDAVYIFTDGYADQFGGPKAKKFKQKTVRELLVSINGETLSRQKNILEQTFLDWKGDLDQVDDVCIIGIRVSDDNHA